MWFYGSNHYKRALIRSWKQESLSGYSKKQEDKDLSCILSGKANEPPGEEADPLVPGKEVIQHTEGRGKEKITPLYPADLTADM